MEHCASPAAKPIPRRTLGLGQCTLSGPEMNAQISNTNPCREFLNQVSYGLVSAEGTTVVAGSGTVV